LGRYIGKGSVRIKALSFPRIQAVNTSGKLEMNRFVRDFARFKSGATLGRRTPIRQNLSGQLREHEYDGLFRSLPFQDGFERGNFIFWSF
jgi:hypothetical protein